jgi:hypothetical protein
MLVFLRDLDDVIHTFDLTDSTTLDEIQDDGLDNSCIVAFEREEMECEDSEIVGMLLNDQTWYLDEDFFNILEQILNFDDYEREVFDYYQESDSIASLVATIVNREYTQYDDYEELGRGDADIGCEYEPFFDFNAYGRKLVENDSDYLELSDGSIVYLEG